MSTPQHHLVKKLFLLLFLFFTAFTAKTQVIAPDLICVNNDTLRWIVPTNSCGSFVSYNVYGSQNFNGPYTLLATITDPAQETYFNDNANNNQWFYYLTTTANCPGQTILSSDTLDNRVPEASPILFADVQNGNVLLEWLPSPSPEVVAYIIYRTTDLGTVPIDTVTTLSYLDLNSNPDANPESYFVIGMDACGNTALLTNPHETMLLAGVLDLCERFIELSWNPYMGWTATDRQEVWVSVDGDLPVLLETVSGTANSVVLSNLVDEKNYCFFIESYDALSGASSSSSVFCQFVDVYAAVRHLQIKNVSVASGGGTTVTWQWNQDAEISDYSVLSSTDNTNFQIISTQAPSASLSLNNNYTDTPSSAATAPVYYQINTSDLCGDIVQSNIGQSIHLSGQASEGFQNQLSWTPFTLDSAEVFQYEVFRLNNTIPVSLGLSTPDVLSWSDSVDVTKSSDASICYFVVASSEIKLANGLTETILSRSNTNCIEQPTGILTPNAFAPAGVNYEFRPILLFGESAEYRMVIRDRWGQQIFATDDVKTGWSGRDGLHEFPTGVYTYQIRVKQSNGRMVEKAGTVTLVR
jgi:fibronectin type 3 domain-containing protein